MRGFRLSIAFLLAGTLTSAEVTAQSSARRQRPIFTQDFRMVAHRGGAALFPENTLEAFRAAAARWPTAVIETDVRLSADGVPVLIHDPTVDRTTNGKGAVAAQPLAELARLDAAYRFSTDGDRTFPSRGRGVRIPTLEEALTALPNTRFQVEIKEGVEAVPPTVAAIQAAQASTRVVLVARRADVLEQVRALAPLVATNFDENAVREIVKLVRGGHPDDRPPPGDMLTAEPRELAAAGFGATEIADLRDGGIPVQGFTIDDPAAMKRLLAEGFTSLVTNRPDLLAEVIAAAPPNTAGAPTTTAVAPAAPATTPPATPGATPTPAATPAMSFRTLVTLGDSIGDPPAGTRPYYAELTKRLAAGSPGGALRVVRGARSGARSRDLAGQARALPADLPGPVAIVITIGGNDLREAAPAAIGGADQAVRQEMRRNLADAIDDLVRPGRFGSGVDARVYLATIYDSSDGKGGFRERGCPIAIGAVATDPIFQRWNADLAELARSRGAAVVDLHGLFRGHGIASDRPWYLDDCIHPNDSGHLAIASAFATAITGLAPAAAPAEPPAAATTAPAPGPQPPAVASAGPKPQPSAGPVPVAPPAREPLAGPAIRDGYFEIRLKSGASFRVRRYTEGPDSIEIKRSGIPFTIRRSEIATIQPVDP